MPKILTGAKITYSYSDVSFFILSSCLYAQVRFRRYVLERKWMTFTQFVFI